FQPGFVQGLAICRKQNLCVAIRHFYGCSDQFLEIFLNVKHGASFGPRKGWRIEDNHVEFLGPAGEASQDRANIVRNETVAFDRQTIQAKVPPASLQRFLRKIDIDRLRADRRSRDRKRAGVSETVEQPLGPGLPDQSAIFALINEQPNRIACFEIDPELEMI